MTASQQTPRRRRGLYWTLGGVAGLIVLLYVGGWFLTGDRVPKGVSVAGVDIGGMTADEAAATLDDELGAQETAPIVVQYDGQQYEIDPIDVGLELDTEATVTEAGGGRSWNPIRMVEILFGSSGDVAPVSTVDQNALDAAIADIADQVDSEPVEPTVTFTAKGRQNATEPVVGAEVDQPASAAAVQATYLVTDEPTDLVVTELAPQVDAEAFQAALTEVADPAVSGPIRLKLPGQSVALPVKDFAPALTLEVEDGELVPVVDPEELEAPIARVSKRIGAAPKDATVVIRNDRPVVVPARPGVELDTGEVADAIGAVITETGDARVAEVGKSVAKADFTTKDAKKLGIEEVVSNFVTYYPPASYRDINQGRAAELINGTIVKPGETFSFNDTVGERTAENGFTQGFIISNGVFREDLGGGVSQVVTTTYNAAFFAGMDDVEHKPHSFYIDRYPMGREATVAWPTVDLKFRNSTPYGVLIQAWVVPSAGRSQGEMHVRMWSTKYWDITAGVSAKYAYTSPGTRYDASDECVENTGYGGFSVDVTRSFRRHGSDEVVKRETKKVTYTPADTVICRAAP